MPRYVDACIARKQAPSDWEPLLRFFTSDRPGELGSRLDALVRLGARGSERYSRAASSELKDSRFGHPRSTGSVGHALGSKSSDIYGRRCDESGHGERQMTNGPVPLAVSEKVHLGSQLGVLSQKHLRTSVHTARYWSLRSWDSRSSKKGAVSLCERVSDDDFRIVINGYEYRIRTAQPAEPAQPRYSFIIVEGQD